MTHKTFLTRNDLATDKRAAGSIRILNDQLIDLIDLHSQTKYAHWNVKGSHFIGLHKLFDELAEKLEEAIDAVAERATALGGQVFGTVRQAAAQSRVPEFPSDVFEGMAVVAALADNYAVVAKASRAAIDEADTLGDADTADLLTDYSRELDQSLWFLEAHLQK